jgi:hypothetical protein
MQLDEVEPAPKDFDVATGFCAVECVFIGNDTAGLEMISDSKGQVAYDVQHLIAR